MNMKIWLNVAFLYLSVHQWYKSIWYSRCSESSPFWSPGPFVPIAILSENFWAILPCKSLEKTPDSQDNLVMLYFLLAITATQPYVGLLIYLISRFYKLSAFDNIGSEYVSQYSCYSDTWLCRKSHGWGNIGHFGPCIQRFFFYLDYGSLSVTLKKGTLYFNICPA